MLKINIKNMGIGVLLFSVLFLSGCNQVSPGDSSNNTAGQVTANNSLTARTYYFESQRAPTGNKVFIFDPQQTAWAAYDETGFKVADGPASGGRDYCPDINSACRTPSGTYKVFRKAGADCVSSKFPVGEGGAPMPYCMFFNGGYAVHGSYAVPNYNASHGCVRVTPGDAQWLSENFMSTGTTVIVKPY